MNEKQILKRLCFFLGWRNINEDEDIVMGVDPNGRHYRLPILDQNFIEEVEQKLDGQQWNAYINELEAIMFNEISDHARFLTFSNKEIGKCILLMRSSASQKAEALINALDFWFATQKKGY
jgi:hypothetical protein